MLGKGTILFILMTFGWLQTEVLAQNYKIKRKASLFEAYLKKDHNEYIPCGRFKPIPKDDSTFYRVSQTPNSEFTTGFSLRIIEMHAADSIYALQTFSILIDNDHDKPNVWVSRIRKNCFVFTMSKSADVQKFSVEFTGNYDAFAASVVNKLVALGKFDRDVIRVTSVGQ